MRKIIQNEKIEINPEEVEKLFQQTFLKFFQKIDVQELAKYNISNSDVGDITKEFQESLEKNLFSNLNLNMKKEYTFETLINAMLNIELTSEPVLGLIYRLFLYEKFSPFTVFDPKIISCFGNSNLAQRITFLRTQLSHLFAEGNYVGCFENFMLISKIVLRDIIYPKFGLMDCVSYIIVLSQRLLEMFPDTIKFEVLFFNFMYTICIRIVDDLNELTRNHLNKMLIHNPNEDESTKSGPSKVLRAVKERVEEEDLYYSYRSLINLLEKLLTNIEDLSLDMNSTDGMVKTRQYLFEVLTHPQIKENVREMLSLFMTTKNGETGQLLMKSIIVEPFTRFSIPFVTKKDGITAAIPDESVLQNTLLSILSQGDRKRKMLMFQAHSYVYPNIIDMVISEKGKTKLGVSSITIVEHIFYMIINIILRLEKNRTNIINKIIDNCWNDFVDNTLALILQFRNLNSNDLKILEDETYSNVIQSYIQTFMKFITLFKEALINNKK
ncbi:MAG: hypothetical protein QM535_15005 [Limnohabitans sp.]|nr:hypothetical protein [Limnohabitans sp.]